MNNFQKKKHQNLIDLTNNFLNEFFEMAAKNEDEERTGRNDSFHFNYNLVRVLMETDHVKNNEVGELNPLIGMGFPEQILKAFFQHNIQGNRKNILFLLENYEKQEPYSDYRARDFKKTSETFTDKGITYRNSKIGFKDVEKTKDIHSFTMSNSKNDFTAQVKVIFIDNKLDQTWVYGRTGELVLIIYHKAWPLDEENFEYTDEPSIQHFKYCADINSYFYVLDNIIYGIKETLKK